MKTVFLLLLSSLVIKGTFAQTTYSSAGQMAIFKADSMMFHHKGNDSTFTLKTTIHALSPLKNQRVVSKGTAEGEIYRVKDEIIKVLYMKTYRDKLADDASIEKSSLYQIYYFKGKPFYVIFSHSEKVQSETVCKNYFDFYVNPREPDYQQSDYFDVAKLRKEVQEIVSEIERL